MKQSDSEALKKSDMFFASPSKTAKALYFYPFCAGHFYCEKDRYLIRFKYNSILISHIIDGEFTFTQNGRTATAKKGDTVIFDSSDPPQCRADDCFESVWTHLGGSNSSELYREIVKNDGNLIKSRDADRLKNLLFRIHNSVSADNPAFELSVSLDIYKVFVELLKPVGDAGIHRRNYGDAVSEIEEFILENLRENLTVSLLADKMHMSSSQFSRVFKSHTGFSPYDYVLASRLKSAKELLQKTDMTISAIAYEIGFNSESNFICLNTENEGISPGRFRNLQFR